MFGQLEHDSRAVARSWPRDRGGKRNKTVLVGLADHPAPDGKDAFPSIRRLVRYTEMSDTRGVRSLGYEQADRPPSPSQPVARACAGLSRRRRAVPARLTMSGLLRGVLVTTTVTPLGHSLGQSTAKVHYEFGSDAECCSHACCQVAGVVGPDLRAEACVALWG